MAGTPLDFARDTGEDIIRVKNLFLTASFTDGAQWAAAKPKPKLQPIYITIDVIRSLSLAAATDDLNHSISYSLLCAAATSVAQSKAFSSLEDIQDEIFQRIFVNHPEIARMSVEVRRPRGLLQPACAEIYSTRAKGSNDTIDMLSINGLECSCIVGINDCEREQKQLVQFDIRLQRSHLDYKTRKPLPYRELAIKLTNAIEESQYLTLEALVSLVAQIALEYVQLDECVTVRGGKPNALACVEYAEVEITRIAKDKDSHQAAFTQKNATDPSAGTHNVAIALGSNLGDRFANIELALRQLELPSSSKRIEGGFLNVIDTSFLYETEPMYVTDQPKFINCVCLVETNIPPVVLLKLLKEVEAAVGRVQSFRNGPRAIDLDILTYDNDIIDTRAEMDRGHLDNLQGQLVVPHPRLGEREFVLRPLNDILPDYVHPVYGVTIRTLFTALMKGQPPETPEMYKVIPFPQYPSTSSTPQTASYWIYPSTSHISATRPRSHKTYIMGTLNATPDSFSDGSENNTVNTALNYVESSLSGGADIIDIGGYSTRPGAAYVSPEEEIQRVVPVIQAIRSMKGQEHHTLVSIDTFRWEVAKAAVEAGANCINDVHAFTGPTYPPDTASNEHFLKMRQVARELAVPVIMMHSRGEASANKEYDSYAYAKDASGRGTVLEGVRVELGEKVNAAVKGKGGIRRWNVIVDPGIGFSKTLEGNLDLLRNSSALASEVPSPSGRRNPLAGYPILIGASRKSFLGAMLQKADKEGTYRGRETEPRERDWATAAAVSTAVQQRALAVRVHDVLNLGDVVRIGRGIWGP